MEAKTLAAVLLIVGLLVGIGIGYGVGYSYSPVKVVEKTVQVPVLSGEIKIGAVLCLTGDLETFGENERAALEIAENEINHMLQAAGAPITIKVLFEDSETKPEVALEKLQTLYAQGVKVVIGMMSSAEVNHVKSYADSNKILVISPSSTSPALAIPNDYVFRFCPDDTKQGPAMARVMWDAGVRYIIPVWRGDAWGDGLVEATKARFEELGGTADEGIRYDPTAPEFSTEVALLADKVQTAINQYGADKVGIYYVAFEEAATFLEQASNYPVLAQVRWFGSDGTAQSTAILKNTAARDFAVATKFVNTYFAPAESEKLINLRDAIKAKLGREPDAYAYNAYDALWVVTKCILIAGKYDSDAIKAILPTVAESTFGASGWIKLNEAGDREIGDYNLWAIIQVDGQYQWAKVGYYAASTDSVTWLYSEFAP
ncbi:MAG: hypothetical protein DRN03_01920 [Thermoplasmata archaeon]|nr:MAG: hypothetical protein DRN03_01920 [Thermoplasmata archaeon]